MDEDIEAELLETRGRRSACSFSSVGSLNGSFMVKFVQETVDKVRPLSGTENKDSQEQVFILQVGKTHVKEKKTKSTRPPKGSALDAYDLKLIKELSQLAFERRLRIERIKDLKKKRDSKAAPSSSSSYISFIFTALLCLVILFQGVGSRNDPVMKLQTSSGSVLSPSGKESLSLHTVSNLSPTEYFKEGSSEGYKSSTPFLNKGPTRENA